MNDADRKKLDEITKILVDNGLLIEAGFASMMIYCDLGDAPIDQIKQMRMAFFAGAQHLMASITSVMDPEAEVTDADLERMDLIHKELNAFITEYMNEAFPHVGGRQ